MNPIYIFLAALVGGIVGGWVTSYFQRTRDPRPYDVEK
jgi:hypothetical protein